jgi:hypothetical protein
MSAFTGLGDLLQQQVSDTAEELRKKKLAQLQAAGRPVSAGLGYDLSNIGGSVSGAFGGTNVLGGR